VTHNQSVHFKQKSRNAFLVIIKGLKYRAFAGFIATLLISLVIVLAELAYSMTMGTFYSIIGISLGLNNIINAGYLGFGLLIISSLIGIVLGSAGIIKKVRLLVPYKSSFLGMGAGIVVWLLLFLPITALLIQPSI
jgi:hypothetical protein